MCHLQGIEAVALITPSNIPPPLHLQEQGLSVDSKARMHSQRGITFRGKQTVTLALSVGKQLSTFTQVLYLSTILRYLCFTWVFPFQLTALVTGFFHDQDFTEISIYGKYNKSLK